MTIYKFRINYLVVSSTHPSFDAGDMIILDKTSFKMRDDKYEIINWQKNIKPTDPPGAIDNRVHYFKTSKEVSEVVDQLVLVPHKKWAREQIDIKKKEINKLRKNYGLHFLSWLYKENY